MRIKRAIVFPFLVGLVVFMGSCYVEPAGDGADSLSLNINLTSQAAVGYSGAGVYIKAYVYDADDVTQMIDAYIIDAGEDYIGYNPDKLFTAENTQAFYVAESYDSPEAYAGIFAIIDLPSTRRYRLLIEWIEYYGEGEESIYYAGLTDEFSVSAGTVTTLVQELYSPYFLS